MIFYCFIFVIFSCLNSPVISIVPYKNVIDQAGDIMVQNLIEKYKNTDHNQFWHPRVSEPARDDNREVVEISAVEKFSIHGNYKQWEHARLGLHTFVLGASNFSVDIYTAADMEKLHSIHNNEKLVAFTTFTKWDEEYYRSEMVIVIATSKPGLAVYRATKDEIKQIGYWPLNYQVKEIKRCQALVHTRLMLIPVSESVPLELYSLETSHTKSNFWFSQRFDVHGKLKAVCYDVIPMQSVIAVSSYTSIKLYFFESSTGLYALHQDIHVENSCTELISFSLSYKNFLGCVPNPRHHIQFFSHSGATYSSVNSLGNHSALVVYAASIENYRDETILLTQDINGDTQILSYNGIKHHFHSGFDCKKVTKCLPIVDLSKGTSYQKHDGTAIYISPSEKATGNSTILIVHTKIAYGAHSPVYRQSRQLYEHFEREHLRFGLWREATANAVNALENALDRSGHNIVTGPWALTNSLSGEQLILKGDSYGDNNEESGVTQGMKNFIFVDQNWTDKDFGAAKEFHKVETQLKTLTDNLAEAMHIMDDALLRNSSEVQIIKSPTVVRGHFTSSQFHGNNIWVDRLWEFENTTQFINNLCVGDSPTPQKIKGTVVFEKPLSMNSMNVEYYNGVQPENVARLSADNAFKSPIEFQNRFTAEGNIHAPAVGGHDLTKELIMINNVKGCRFEQGIMTRDTKIDDLHFNFDDILLKSTDQEVKTRISFEEVRAKNNAHAEKIHGLPFKAFVDNIVLQDYGGMISGRTKILGTMNCTKISNLKTLNNVPFPNAYVRNNQPVVHMTGMQNFSRVIADKVIVDGGILNGINIDRMWIGLSTASRINSTWICGDKVTIVRNMNVTDKLNGIDLNLLKHNEFLNKRKDGWMMHSDVKFTKPVVLNSLHVQSKVNGKTHEEMFDGVLIFDGKECHIPHETELAHSLYLQNLHISTGLINLQPLNTLVTLNTVQNISGHMTLAEESFFHELHTSVVDSVHLASFFDSTIRLSNPGIINSSLHLENFWCHRNFSTNGLINGHITLRTLVALTAGRHQQMFHGQGYVFDHLVCDEVEVTNNLNVTKGKTIGDVDLMDWYSSRLRLDTDQRIYSPVIFHGRGTALKNLNVENINGVPFEDLEHNSLRKNSNMHTFSNAVHADKMYVNGKVLCKGNTSRHSLDEVKHNALPLNSNDLHVIPSNWEFQSMSIAGDLIVHGETCGVNVKHLNDDIVKKGENNTKISAEKTFTDTVNVNQALNIHSLNGNVNFSRNLISLNDPNVTITGHVTFRKNLMVKKDLHMNYVNDISVAKFCNAYSFDNNNTHVIRQDIVAEELVGHSLEVRGLYQNKNISESLARIVKTSGPRMKINGDKVFTDPVHLRGEISVGQINDINLLRLANNVVMTNKPHIFSGPVHFKNFRADQCIVNNYMESEHISGNYNLTYLSQHAIYINGHHQGNIKPYSGFHFESILMEKDFHTDEVNGIPIDNYIRLDGPPQFISNLVVENARFSGPNIFVQNNVGGLNLPEEYTNTLMDDSPIPQHVKGNTFFTKPIQVKGNLVCADEHLPQSVKDVVTKEHDHTIYGQVVFLKPVHVKDMIVTQTVSGHTMEQYLSEPLTYDGDQEIPASWRFKGDVTFEEDVIGEGKLDSYDLKNIIKEIKYNVSLAAKVVEKDLQAFRDLCTRLDSVTKYMSRTSMKLDHFDTQQNMMLRKQVDKVSTIQTQGTLILLMFTDACEIFKYIWNYEQEFFYEIQPTSLMEPKLGKIKDVQTFSWNREGLLVYSTEMSDCAPLAQGLYVVSVDRTGKVSTPTIIIASLIVDFKIIDIKGKVFMFVITDKSTDIGQEVIIFSWHSSGKFVAEQYLYLKVPLLKLEITEFQLGIACLLQTRYGIFTYYYAMGSKTVNLIGFTEYAVKQNSSMVLFNSHGTLFIIVQERGAEDSLIQPSCSLQVFRIYNGKTQRLQNLHGGDVLAINMVQFSDMEILISVISKQAPVMFYKFMGLSGLQPLYSHPVKLFNAKQIHFFNVKPWTSKSQRPFFLQLTKNTAIIFRSVVFGSTMEKRYENYEDICSLQ